MFVIRQSKKWNAKRSNHSFDSFKLKKGGHVPPFFVFLALTCKVFLYGLGGM